MNSLKPRLDGMCRKSFQNRMSPKQGPVEAHGLAWQIKQGIRVNSVSPGYVRTEMTAAFSHLTEKWKADIMNHRLAEPDDIRGACVFLASDASSYMTGQDICVDGGVTKW
ncbi:hypothetical protein ACJ72_01310 [Emergomyces africanus]|uniref:Uncharacterized protein n=1 Tax=Emergomyces africanus TaxID=1955775 RepID=A0A1B7P5K9_9EURO|nr:hypothetical protein ACJ72_01310 [Emergomyces africanus]